MPRVVLSLALEAASVLPIEIDVVLHEALKAQLRRAALNLRTEDLYADLSRSVSQAIYSSLDRDLQLPTPQQIDVVIAIAKELNIDLPSGVLRSNGATATFISRFIRRYRLSRKERIATAVTLSEPG